MEGNGVWSAFTDSAVMSSSNQPSSQTPKPFYKTIYPLDYTQYIPICQVLKHIKNPQKYPNMVDKLIKNVYNVWIIWGK
jgi:hypothetical protein